MANVLTAQNIAFWGFVVIAIIMLGFAAMVLWKIFQNQISLDGLLAEPPPADNPTVGAKASLSRFQFLIFTFVIAGLYLLLSIEAGTFVEIPGNVLLLLGISSGSYVVSKMTGGPSKPTPPAAPTVVQPVVVTPPSPTPVVPPVVVTPPTPPQPNRG
jgi:hypothetical protein